MWDKSQILIGPLKPNHDSQVFKAGVIYTKLTTDLKLCLSWIQHTGRVV